jgi:hypothetical protein
VLAGMQMCACQKHLALHYMLHRCLQCFCRTSWQHSDAPAGLMVAVQFSAGAALVPVLRAQAHDTPRPANGDQEGLAESQQPTAVAEGSQFTWKLWASCA